LEVYDLYDASEVFMTCTPYSILPVVRINGRNVGTGKPGSVTKKLIQEWSDSVGCDMVEQTKKW